MKYFGNVKSVVFISFKTYRKPVSIQYQSSIENFHRRTSRYLDTFPGRKHFCNLDSEVHHLGSPLLDAPAEADIKIYANVIIKSVYC